MFLLLFSDVVRFTSAEDKKQRVTIGGSDFISVPELLPSKIYLPFICDTYLWYEGSGLCPEMRTVHQVLIERDWEVMKFFKEVWTTACAGGIEHIDSALTQASKFSANLQLSHKDAKLLKSSVWKLILNKFLKNIGNATSHSDGKLNTNILSFYIQHIQYVSDKNEDVLSSAPWNQSLLWFLRRL